MPCSAMRGFSSLSWLNKDENMMNSILYRKVAYGDRAGNESGFTLIELILVIVLIGILVSTAAQKMISMAEDAEITAENSTVEVLRKNLLSNYGENLVKGLATRFPDNPFINLSKVPDGYDPQRTTRPNGTKVDNGLWIFILGSASISLTPQQAGTTLPTFRPTGIIYHQRRDQTVVKWAYDSSLGVISAKIIETESDLKRQLDLEKQQRGEQTESERLARERRQVLQ